MNDGMFSQIDFGPLKGYLEDEDITDISYSNSGQIWLKSLSKGIYRTDNLQINNTFMEKLAFQCSNVMGKSFNMAEPFLDAEGAELRLNFVHDSIAKNGIAVVIRKTPAKIRLQKEKLLNDKYVDLDIHDFLIYCVLGHCNIIVCGETGSGKTEFVKYLAAHTREDEKLITIEDTLELHLDRIFPHRDIVTMKTNNIASYSDVLVTCMRQNPKWILLSEVRSAEAVMAVRNSISSGHYILSTIHADKAASIPNRMYSLLETNQDIEQFLKSIHRYVQIGVYIRGYQDKKTRSFHREIAEVTEFYVTNDNKAESNTIYRKGTTGRVIRKKPSQYLVDYLDAQGVVLPENIIEESETDGGSTALEIAQNPSKIENPNIKSILEERPNSDRQNIGNVNREFRTINPTPPIQNPIPVQPKQMSNIQQISRENKIEPKPANTVPIGTFSNLVQRSVASPVNGEISQKENAAISGSNIEPPQVSSTNWSIRKNYE